MTSTYGFKPPTMTEEERREGLVIRQVFQDVNRINPIVIDILNDLKSSRMTLSNCCVTHSDSTAHRSWALQDEDQTILQVSYGKDDFTIQRYDSRRITLDDLEVLKSSLERTTGKKVTRVFPSCGR